MMVSASRTVAAVAAVLVVLSPSTWAQPAPAERSSTAAGSPANSVQSVQTETTCAMCHGMEDLWEADTAHLLVLEDHLRDDVHWKLGFNCQDCHGGNPEADDFLEAHAVEAGFQSLSDPANVPNFCGKCHSDVELMTRYHPSPITSQEAEYWTSGHGQAVRERGDEGAATCIDCHGGHGMRSVDDPLAPTARRQLAETCAKCHADEDLMAERQYDGRPLGHDQFALWSQSVHGKPLLEQGELATATCHDCHGTHGTVVPDVLSVSNACGSCHVKAAELFNQTLMKHALDEVQIPGCVACHGAHAIEHPTDEMLGMHAGAVCAKCHEGGQFGATLAGAEVARSMHARLDNLKTEIQRVQTQITQAELMGLEVHGPKFDLRQAFQSLENARTLVHSFALAPISEALEQGLATTDAVSAAAQQAIDQHTFRRRWLAASLLPIFLAIMLLLLTIRSLPLPTTSSTTEPPGKGSPEIDSPGPAAP